MEELELVDEESVLEHSQEKVPKYAGFWIRVAASIVDVLVMVPGFLIMRYAMSNNSDYVVTVNLVILTLHFIYKPLLEWHFGATLGKMVMNIQVVGTSLKNASAKEIIGRNSVFIAPALLDILNYIYWQTVGFSNDTFLESQEAYDWVKFVVSALLIASCLVVAFNSKKQGLHDMLGNTYVVYKER